MIDEFLQGQAALYVAGAMTRDERERFELILEFHEQIRGFTEALAAVGAAIALSTQPEMKPSPGLKGRIFGMIENRPQEKGSGFVATDPQGLVHWVNPEFTAMCGYSLDELRGKKLGSILQGAETDRETVERMRNAVHDYRPCRETILNYHKNGSPYWVEVAITPIFNDEGQPLWLVARERELARAA